MTTLRLTLLTDGPTDQALLPIVRWLVRENGGQTFEQNWADLRRLRDPPCNLGARVKAALDLFPCDLLIVHRDAEREPAENRVREIASAASGHDIPVVCAVPVRMTEAWLLFDEAAIRRAAGCPKGTVQLELPAPRNVESLPDPKQVLHEALKTASTLSGRRLAKFRPDIRRVAELIDDFTPLRATSSFSAFEDSLRNALDGLAGRGSSGYLR